MDFGLRPSFVRRLDLLGGLSEPIEPFSRLRGHSINVGQQGETIRQGYIGARRAECAQSPENQGDTIRCLPHDAQAPPTHDIAASKPKGKTLFTGYPP